MFVKDLRELQINTNNVVMASFDVKSLFTNIPLDETISIIVNKCFYNTSRFHGFTVDQFTPHLNLSVKNCHFLFDGVLYKQVDGVAMGSPLGPLFANIFLSFHEKYWLADCPSNFKTLFYRRYVDDCFLIFRSRDHVLPFLSYLNSKHSNIHACDVILSVYPHRASLKNMPDHGGNQTYDLWNTSPMLCQLSYVVWSVRVIDISEQNLVPSISMLSNNNRDFSVLV